MIARYNVYFNATQKFNAATDELYEKHVDDFEKFIEIYPYGTAQDKKALRAPMEEVMKKASKVIQHRPHSKWVDDAYFLIGKTHFFSNDPFSAIETFQYVYSKYSDPFIKASSQLWVMKSYILQDKYNDAEAILSLIRENKAEYRDVKAQTHLVAGDLYVKLEKYQQAIEELSEGVKLVKNKQLRYRTNFLLGQLYLEVGQYEEANKAFVQVIKANSPYEYVFQANLGLTKATAESGGKGLKSTKKNLKKMLKDDKNIDYFDQIYYELALLEFVEGNEKTGLDYLIKSSSNAGSNAKQQTKTYLFLADYFFKNREYDRSQAYFDSAVSVIPNDYPERELISSRHAVLSKLIDNIQTVQVQDSLLALSMLPKNELEKKIRQIVQEEQRAERLAAEEAELRRQRELLNSGSSTITDPTAGGSGVWYFYNAAQVARGTNDFERKWGKREHDDWWRYANKSVMEATDQTDPEPTPDDDPLDYDPEADQEQQDYLETIAEDLRKYYEKIPFSATAKLMANKKIQNSLLELSKIYFENLEEYGKSKTNLLRLTSDYPQSEQKAEGLFYLAKSCLALGDSACYKKYALQIAEEHPNTPYNQVLNNKEVIETGEDQEVIDLYARMYKAYIKDSFDISKQLYKLAAKEYAGNSIQAKFDYLYALTIGKTDGRDAYVAELEAIAENYPGTEIANNAAYTVKLLRRDSAEAAVDISMYSNDVRAPHYYVVVGTTDDVKKIEQELSEYNNKFYPGKNFLIKSLIFNDKQLFYIKSFENKDIAQRYHIEMRSNVEFLRTAGLSEIKKFAISESNFKTLIKEQDLNAYMVFFNKHYPVEL